MLQENTTKQDSFERYKERLSNFSKDFEFGLFIFIAKRSVWFCAFFFVAAGLLSFVYLRYAPIIYESSTVIQINTSNNANKVLQVANIYEYEDQNEVASTIELLRSKIFLKRALATLPLDVSYFAEGTFKTNEHYKNSFYRVEYKLKAAEIYGTQIRVQFAANGKTGELSYGAESGAYTAKFKCNEWFETPNASFLITVDPKQSSLLQDSKNKYYFTVNDMDILSGQYYPRLGVTMLNDAARTISITFSDNSPVKANDVVTALSREFISYDVERRSKSAANILDFIESQLDTVYKQLKISENSLQDFRRNHNINDNEDETRFYLERYGAIENQLTQVQLEEQVLTEIETKIAGNSVSNVNALLSLLAGSEYQPNISNQLNALYKLLSDRSDALRVAKEGSEIIQDYDFKIETQKRLLIGSIKSIRESVTSKRRGLNEKLGEYKAKIGTSPEDETRYAGLQRLFSINEKFYTLLLEKRTEYEISKAGFTPLHMVLEKSAVPSFPISPNRLNTLLAAFLLAVIASLILVVYRYITHDTINSLNDISKLTNATISALGIIPKYSREIPVSQLLIDKNPKSMIAEAFRTLRTNLEFIDNTPGPKVMAVTSTISGEGKTFVAINLAGIIAYSGKRVIILDLDMRKPKIHKGFNTENTRGMSTILIGKDSIADCTRQSSLENLFFITAGPTPPNPSELIISKKMDEIVEELKKTYDLIIIDNPPVGLVTDGIATIRKADYPIYIFRAEYSRRNFVQIADRLYNESGIKRLSVVLNGVDATRKNYGYNYGYGYGYGYGYSEGYGYYDEKPEENKKPFSRFMKFKK